VTSRVLVKGVAAGEGDALQGNDIKGARAINLHVAVQKLSRALEVSLRGMLVKASVRRRGSLTDVPMAKPGNNKVNNPKVIERGRGGLARTVGTSVKGRRDATGAARVAKHATEAAIL
jgi:hypothetical protein